MIDGMNLDGMNLLPDNPEAFLPPETDKAPSGGEEVEDDLCTDSAPISEDEDEELPETDAAPIKVEPEVPETKGKSILNETKGVISSLDSSPVGRASA